MPSPKNIIIGQPISSEKAARAKELRRNQTPAERILWEQLRANRLGGWHFHRQQIIAGFIVDFYCHAAGLAVELDGGVHDLTQDYDAERDRALAGLGIRVLRFNNQAVVENLAEVLEHILQACIRQAPC